MAKCSRCGGKVRDNRPHVCKAKAWQDPTVRLDDPSPAEIAEMCERLLAQRTSRQWELNNPSSDPYTIPIVPCPRFCEDMGGEG